MSSNGANPFAFVDLPSKDFNDNCRCATCCLKKARFVANNSKISPYDKPETKYFKKRNTSVSTNSNTAELLPPKQENFPQKILIENLPCFCSKSSPTTADFHTQPEEKPTEKLTEPLNNNNKINNRKLSDCYGENAHPAYYCVPIKQSLKPRQQSINLQNSRKLSQTLHEANPKDQLVSTEINETASCLKITEEITTKRILKLYPDQDRQFSKKQLEQIIERTAPFNSKDFYYYHDGENTKEILIKPNTITDSYLDLLSDVLKIQKSELKFLTNNVEDIGSDNVKKSF